MIHRPSLRLVLCVLVSIVAAYALTIMALNIVVNPFANGDPFKEFMPQMYLLAFIVLPVLFDSTLVGLIFYPKGNLILIVAGLVNGLLLGLLCASFVRAFIGPWAGSYDLGFFWPATVAAFVGTMTAAQLSRRSW